MSWHCFCDDSTNEKKPWVHVHVAFIDGGIPITFVCHADCLRKAICEDKGILREGMGSIDDEFLDRIKERGKTMMLTDEDKELIGKGTFIQQTGLLVEHFNDEAWIEEAHAYLKKTMDGDR